MQGPQTTNQLSTYQDVRFLHDDDVLMNDDQPHGRTRRLGCELCGIKVSSERVLERHLEGRRHIMRVRRQGKTFECEVCNITANGQSQLDHHLKSARHRQKVHKKEHPQEITTNGMWIILFFVGCIFLNLLLMLKMFL